MMAVISISEEQRQLIILALAKLRARRPGWAELLEETAGALEGRLMYQELLKLESEPDDVR
jgi:hypothetical protein